MPSHPVCIPRPVSLFLFPHLLLPSVCACGRGLQLQRRDAPELHQTHQQPLHNPNLHFTLVPDCSVSTGDAPACFPCALAYRFWSCTYFLMSSFEAVCACLVCRFLHRLSAQPSAPLSSPAHLRCHLCPCNQSPPAHLPALAFLVPLYC